MPKEGMKMRNSVLNMKAFEIVWKGIPKYSYLRELPALNNLERMEFRKNITLFCGENGSGKSTILRALAEAWGLNPRGGTRNYIVDEDQRSELGHHLLVYKGNSSCYRAFFRSDSLLQTVREMEHFWSESGMMTYGDRPVDDLSHGESFRALLDTFVPGGLYFLDEPDGAFSVQNLLVFMSKVIAMSREGAQFVIVTHSLLLLGLPDADIYCFGEDGVLPCAYEDTDAYQISKAFLNNREKMLRYLCGE